MVSACAATVISEDARNRISNTEYLNTFIWAQILSVTIKNGTILSMVAISMV
jgi:hypothetical protein